MRMKKTTDKTIETAKDSLRIIKEYLNNHEYDYETNCAYWKLVNFVNLMSYELEVTE